MGVKSLGSRFTQHQFALKLAKVSSGFELKPKDFKAPIAPALFNNGANGAYIVQCRKLTFSYCEVGGSSRGMVGFIKNEIVNFAKNNPETEVIVKHQPRRHPRITGVYCNGTKKSNLVANMGVREIRLNAEGLQSSQGGTEVDFRKQRVISTNPSVRGIWSPFHCAPHQI